MNSHIIGTLIYALIILILLLSIGYILMLFHRFLDHILKTPNHDRNIENVNNEAIVYVQHVCDSGPPTYDEVVRISELYPHAFPTPKLLPK